MLHERRHWPVMVVGAGPAGLAVSHELQRRGLQHVVLERGQAVGTSWRSYYTGLVLHTGKHLSSLPGMPFGRRDPLFAPRARFVEYLERYAGTLRLPIQTGTEARAARHTDGEWEIATTEGTWHAGVLVVATGIASAPLIPSIPGADAFTGGVRHSVAYRDPSPFVGHRVLVVGAGNSGAEIAAELGRAGIETSISVRSGVIVVPLTIAGIPTQYIGIGLRRLPRMIAVPIARGFTAVGARRRGDGLPQSRETPLDVIPLVGLHLSDAIRAGLVTLRPGLTDLTPTGARFADGSEAAFDQVVFATGFTAAVGWLDGAIKLDSRGFARRRNRVVSADQPHLLFVGHTYDAGGALVNIRRDAGMAARAAVAMLDDGR